MSAEAARLHVYVCRFDGCGREFSKPSRLLHHTRTHTGERPYVCPDSACGKKYTRSAHLNRHIEQSHTEASSPRYSCTVEGCGQTFVSNQNYQKHMKRKHDTAKWKCPEEGCEERFRKHHQLKAHVYSHKGVLPFQCHHEGCLRKFTIKSRLDRHMKIHQGYKCPEEGCEEIFPRWSDIRKHRAVDHRSDLKCGECDKTFTTLHYLNKHKETHNPNRSVYICPHEGCKRSYSQMRNLFTHIRSSHEGKRFTCHEEDCGKSFSTKQKCKEHQRKVHDPHATPKPKYKRLNQHRKTTFASKVTGVKDGTVPLLPSVNENDSDWREEMSSEFEEMEETKGIPTQNRSPHNEKTSTETKPEFDVLRQTHIPDDLQEVPSETKNPIEESNNVLIPKSSTYLLHQETSDLKSNILCSNTEKDMGMGSNMPHADCSVNETCQESDIHEDNCAVLKTANVDRQTVNVRATQQQTTVPPYLNNCSDPQGESFKFTVCVPPATTRDGQIITTETTEEGEMVLSELNSSTLNSEDLRCNISIDPETTARGQMVATDNTKKKKVPTATLR